MNIAQDLQKKSYNGEMDEGYLLVSSTIQTNRKQNESNSEDFKQ